MPKLNGWYPMKKPLLQIKILKLIALAGVCSQREVIFKLNCKPSTISEAFKVLKNRKLVMETKAPELASSIKREKFYKLSIQGIAAFTDERPSPGEFWKAMAWYCTLNPQDADKIEINKYYNLFINTFIGNFPIRSCFFLGNLFENLVQQWCKRFDDKRHNYKLMMLSYKFPEIRKAYKVLECLLLNRGITIEKIIELTQLSEIEIRKVLKDYSITQSSYYRYAEDYEYVYESSRSISSTTNLLNHFLIVPTKLRREEKEYNNKDQKYELSLMGILLTMSLTSLMRQQHEDSYSVNYSKIATNYSKKLPHIFGKWGMLKNILDFDTYPSIFDYLLSECKSEILSLSVSLGGNKEIYDNIRSATLSTISKLYVVYDEGISALQSDDYPEKFFNSDNYQFMLEKLHEIEISLKYSDLESFANYMKNKKINSDSDSSIIDSFTSKSLPSRKAIRFRLIANRLFVNGREEENLQLEDDLHFIENALADEFTLLFYISQLRENNHKASDYPLTTGFLRPSPTLAYPKLFLIKILNNDKKIRDRLAEWIKEASTYQKQSLAKIDEIYASIKNG